MDADAPAPVRATYSNLYKWPESDAEFMKSMISGEGKVVDGLSSRQLYFRSYTFSTEDQNYMTKIKCLLRLAKRAVRRKRRSSSLAKRTAEAVKRKRRTSSCGGGGRKSDDDSNIFRRMLACTFKLDVLD
ncbi:hypothetical protein DH2020_013882 [Rehmannia glutinosa]|uniref:Uncharacterized protein n=1 Tax=Rehmannia glutinosa TaxID=99300 RepID=A0ABR0W5J4_REHGL